MTLSVWPAVCCIQRQKAWIPHTWTKTHQTDGNSGRAMVRERDVSYGLDGASLIYKRPQCRPLLSHQRKPVVLLVQLCKYCVQIIETIKSVLDQLGNFLFFFYVELTAGLGCKYIFIFFLVSFLHLAEIKTMPTFFFFFFAFWHIKFWSSWVEYGYILMNTSIACKCPKANQNTELSIT